MIKKFGYKNIMEVPKLTRSLSTWALAKQKTTQKSWILQFAAEIIAGQKAVRNNKAKKSVANFKLRGNMAIGCKVTLRGEKMYEFADRLINLASSTCT